MIQKIQQQLSQIRKIKHNNSCLKKNLTQFQQYKLTTLKQVSERNSNQNYLKNVNFQSRLQFYNFCQQKDQKQSLDLGLQEIRDVLQGIQIEGKNVINSNVVQNLQILEGGKIQMQIKTNLNFRKVSSIIRSSIKEKVPWAKNIDIQLAGKDSLSILDKKQGLSKVKKIIAVSSCKGGVGKSTVSINLAFSLQKLGKKVGIFDADIYGPSLPTLINRETSKLYAHEDNPKSVIPIEYEGLKAMSYGFVTQQQSILRGPLVSSIVSQLIHQCDWGELDYLVVDMPPGTGDIQITLCQELQLTAAVIVTTPQKLSFVDVVKGIHMFDSMKVPTVSIVENMQYFTCDGCGKVHQPFGQGYLNMIIKQFGIKNSLAIPIEAQISKGSDSGKPACLVLPEEHEITKAYSKLAESVEKEILALESLKIPVVRYQTGTQEVIVQEYGSNKILKKIKARELRKKCQCAICIDEFTGESLIDENKIAEDIYPHKIEPKGNYAVAMVWNDGHNSSLYPYERLLNL